MIGKLDEDAQQGIDIKFGRFRKGWRQYELAEQVGIHPARLSEIESGRRIPAPEILRRLRSLLELDVHDP